MLGFIAPAALAFAALALPILLFYMLKLRRQEIAVSSTLLWQRLLRDREANMPWQRLRRNLMLLLQLLALALLTLALARPFVPSPAIAGGSTVLLLDASASMQATDTTPSRFEAARQAARDILDGLGPRDSVTIITAAPQPAMLISNSTDHTALRRALEQASPANGPADWETACALAQASLSGVRDPHVVILSDGAFAGPLPPVPGEIRFVRVGERGDNVAVGALAIREGNSGPQAFFRANNLGDTEIRVLAEFRADGTLLDVRSLTLPPSGAVDIGLADLPYDLALLEARLIANDPLPLDNVAWAVRGRSTTRRVLLITPGNLFLDRALSILPGLEVTRLAPGQPLPAEPYDLVVVDAPLTTTLPVDNAWIIGPLGEPSGVFTNTMITRVAADDPILRYVDLGDTHVLQAWRTVPPPGARILVEAAGGPLLFVVEQPEGRLAVMAFDLHDSDLPLQIAFPILVANLTNWLLPWGRSAESVALRPGDPLSIQPIPEGERIAVTDPDGSRYVLDIRDTVPVFAATDPLGVYQIAHLGADGTALRTDLVAVNLFDDVESDIQPQEVVRVGQSEVSVAAAEEAGQREFWPWLAGLALVVISVEWWAYHRGAGRGRIV